MRWFRDHIRHGSWLALIAIAINFAVAFGHVHGFDGAGSELGLTSRIATVAGVDGDRTQKHPADQADYLCPICMAAAAMGTALAPTPPALPVEFADAAIDRAIEHVITIPHAPRAAFQSRGPPLS
jgi:hypothetical protein